ncbi:MAG: electron transfer flavoprotein, partial [Cyanobacteria bacterium J06629_2]
MKLNKLAGFGIASIVLFGSVGQLALNAQPVQAQRAGRSVIAAKSQSLIASGSFVTTEQDHPTNGTAKIVEKNG